MSEILKLSCVVSWAEIQMQEGALIYAMYRDIRATGLGAMTLVGYYMPLILSGKKES